LSRQTQLWHRAVGERPRRSKKSRRTAVVSALVGLLIVTGTGLWPLLRADRGLQQPSPASTPDRSPPLAQNWPHRPPQSAERAVAIERGSRSSAPVKLAAATGPAVQSAADDVILSTDKRLRPGRLDLTPGKRVRGLGGKRPLVAIPAEGLSIACEDVCFEGIDFVWELDPSTHRGDARTSVMFHLAAQTVEFRGCSFVSLTDEAPLAIAWTGAVERLPGAVGEIVLVDCVFQGLSAVVDCFAGGELSVELNNALCVASGPIVRLSRPPKSEESIAVSLARTTARGDSAVLECRYARPTDQSGPITIVATESVLDANPRGGLVILSGSEPPGRLLSTITWNGQGSLVTPHTVVALWRNGNKKPQVLPEDGMEVAGLVRSAIEFAGRADAAPSASRLIRWQGPLRSADPPGADVEQLFVSDR
jgi:hypothetical protein